MVNDLVEELIQSFFLSYFSISYNDLHPRDNIANITTFAIEMSPPKWSSCFVTKMLSKNEPQLHDLQFSPLLSAMEASYHFAKDFLWVF